MSDDLRKILPPDRYQHGVEEVTLEYLQESDDRRDWDVTPDDCAGPSPNDARRARLLSYCIDWSTVWAKDLAAEEWLVEPIIPAGRAVSIFARGGVGKSLLMLYMAAALATGNDVFGLPVGKARKVLYVDFEMTEADVIGRLESMGYGPDTDLSNLYYALHAPFDPLDTAAGGAQLAGFAAAIEADLVLIDTFGAAVTGPENEADTVRAFKRHTGNLLKAAGRTMVRADHAGKDIDKGARGTSAKDDDVDLAWAMTKRQGGYRLQVNKQRPSWIPETVELLFDTRDDVLRFRFVPGSEPGWAPGTKEACDNLDALGVPVDVSSRKATVALREAGFRHRNEAIRDAVKYRKQAKSAPGARPNEDPPKTAPDKSGRA